MQKRNMVIPMGVDGLNNGFAFTMADNHLCDLQPDMLYNIVTWDNEQNAEAYTLCHNRHWLGSVGLDSVLMAVTLEGAVRDVNDTF